MRKPKKKKRCKSAPYICIVAMGSSERQCRLDDIRTDKGVRGFIKRYAEEPKISGFFKFYKLIDTIHCKETKKDFQFVSIGENVLCL